ncbi:MAG: hypothetical protein ACXW2I_13080 [Burkholderiales bacterium]
MAAFTIRRFSQPGRLKTIAPAALAAFFRPYADYLRDRGFTFAPDLLGGFCYDTLASILISPDGRVPREMVDALYFVDELADEEGMDALLEAASDASISLHPGSEPTPADVAIEAWLKSPELVKRVHARGHALRQKRFHYFRSRTPDRFSFPEFESSQMASLQCCLEEWFETHKRGRYCGILIFCHGTQVWFVVRHGLPFVREGSITERGPSMQYYRPEKYDVLVYDSDSGTLAVHADGKRLTSQYLFGLGLFLIGNERQFTTEHKLTLDPLKRYGADSLACDDIAGINSVTLVELTRMRGGPYKRMVIDKASDLFADFAAEGDALPETARLISATLEFAFAEEEKPRRVTIRPPNTIGYARNEDRDMVEPFLRVRGFMPARSERQVSEAEPLLADA